jgi:hypothetical protein
MTGNLIVDTNTLYVDSTNNRVGIGTTGPDYPLDVIASSTSTIQARSTAGQAVFRLRNATKQWKLTTDTNDLAI